MVSRSILFVDDYDMLRKIYLEILSDAGYEVQGASGAKECMESLSQGVPDLILLDIMMKPVDGWTTLNQIRTFSSSSQVPVIMISGKAILPQEITNYAPSIDGYLRKPLQNVTLLQSLEDFFIWFEKLTTECERARKNGGDPDLVDQYFSSTREYRSSRQMNEMIHREYDKGRDNQPSDILTEAFAEIDSYIQTVEKKLRDTADKIGITPDFS
jgi:two-component system, OmpR family, response regulator